jgi:hypothetical protein
LTDSNAASLDLALRVGADDIALGILTAHLRGLILGIRIRNTYKRGCVTHSDRAGIELLTLLSANDVTLAILAADLEETGFDLDLTLLGADFVSFRVLAAHLEEASLDIALGAFGARRLAVRVQRATSTRGDDHGLGVGADLVTLRILTTDDRRRKLELGSALFH